MRTILIHDVRCGMLTNLLPPRAITPDTLSAVSQHRVKRPWKARRNEVMTHSAALVDKLLLDNIAQEIVYDNDAVTVTQRHPDQGLSEITGLRRNACSEV